MTDVMRRNHTGNLLAVFALRAASLAFIAVGVGGCTSCESTNRLHTVGIGEAAPVTVQALIPQGATSVRWHCWSGANGPRVQQRFTSLTWRVPGSSTSASDITLYELVPANEGRIQIPSSCTADACPAVIVANALSPCGEIGVCETFTWDIELNVQNPAAIPPSGLATEFVLTAKFFAQASSGGGGIDQPQPADADISDINIDMGCALASP